MERVVSATLTMIRSLQDWAWHKYKKNGQATGQRCARCVQCLTRAYPLLSWEELLTQKAASPDFSKKLDNLIRNYELVGKLDEWVKEDYQWCTCNEIRVERDFLFFSKDEFQRRFQCTPASLNIVPEILHDDNGSKMTGYIVRDDAEPLRIKSSYSVKGRLAQLLQPASMMIRPQQASEFAAAYEPDAQKLLPKPLTRPSDCIALSAIPAMKAKADALREQKEAEEQALAALVPEPVPDSSNPVGAEGNQEQRQEEEDQDDEEDEEETGALGQGLLQSQQLLDKGKGPKKGKGGKKGKAKCKGKGKSKPKGAPPAEADAVSLVSAASSKLTSGGARVSPRAVLLDKAKNWRKALDIKAIMEGVSHGQTIWRAGQTLSALEKTHAGEPEVVLLGAHLNFARLAEDL